MSPIEPRVLRFFERESKRILALARANSAKPKYHVPEVNLGEDLTADEGEHQLSQLNDNELSELLDSARQLMNAAGKFQTGYRINQRDSVLVSYRAALLIATGENGWNTLCRRLTVIPEIEEKELTRDKTLTLVLLAAFEKVDRDARKSASLFKRALGPSFDAKLSDKQVLALLEKHRGFKGLAKLNAKKKPAQAKSKHDVALAEEQPVRRPTQRAAELTANTPAVTAKGPQGGRPLGLTIAATLVGGGRHLLRFKAGSKIELHGRLESLDEGSVVITIDDASIKE